MLKITTEKLMLVAGIVWAIAGANIANIGLGAYRHDWGSVSYTHLDVYKRQGHFWWVSCRLRGRCVPSMDLWPTRWRRVIRG